LTRMHALAVVVAISMLAACTTAASNGGGGQASPGLGATSGPSAASAASSAVPLPSGPPRVTASTSFHLGAQRGGTTFAFGSAWVAGGRSLVRVDPATSAVLATIAVEKNTKFLSEGGGFLWASSADGPTDRIDPKTNSVMGTLPAGRVFGFGSLWDFDSSGTLNRIDPTSGAVTASLKVEGAPGWQPQLAVGFGSVWIAAGDLHQVLRVDPANATVVATIGGISTEDSLLVVNTGFNAVWVDANAAGTSSRIPGSGLLYRIDPTTNVVTSTTPVGDPNAANPYGGTDIGIGEGSVWTADSSATVTRIDPTTSSVVAVRKTGNIEFVAAGFGSVWANDGRFDATLWAP
jgi:hypothetical protein